MSPLARSLLAFAALLAAAHGYCNTKTVDSMGPCDDHVDYQPIYFQPDGTIIDIPQNYCPVGMHVAGEEITACNNNPYGPPPNISGPPYGQKTPVRVSCYYTGYPQCPQGGNVNIKQCCRYDYPH